VGRLDLPGVRRTPRDAQRILQLLGHALDRGAIEGLLRGPCLPSVLHAVASAWLAHELRLAALHSAGRHRWRAPPFSGASSDARGARGRWPTRNSEARASSPCVSPPAPVRPVLLLCAIPNSIEFAYDTSLFTCTWLFTCTTLQHGTCCNFNSCSLGFSSRWGTVPSVSVRRRAC